MDNYLIIIEKTESGDGYGAYSPDLPGCFATGKTVEDVARRMSNAIQGFVEQCAIDGLPLPSPTTVVAYMQTVSLPTSADHAA